MINKLTLILVIVECIFYTASLEQSLGIVAPKYNDKYYSDSDILSSMSFLNNQRCVQFICSESIKCIANVFTNYENITYFVRSMSWLLARNIYIEESKYNLLKKNSTKYCENFLIFLKDVSSLKLFVKAIKTSNSEATFFPFSKLYFLFEDKNYKFIRSEMADVSTFFCEIAQFGYIFEYHSVANTLRLRNLLSLHYTNITSNLQHPFISRENHQKEFRISFHHCFPYVIYADEKNLR